MYYRRTPACRVSYVNYLSANDEFGEMYYTNIYINGRPYYNITFSIEHGKIKICWGEDGEPCELIEKAVEYLADTIIERARKAKWAYNHRKGAMPSPDPVKIAFVR